MSQKTVAELVEIAKSEYSSDFEIAECVDIGTCLAFFFTCKGIDEVPPGLPIICVDKFTGEVSTMTIPPISNLLLLEKGKRIVIR